MQLRLAPACPLHVQIKPCDAVLVFTVPDDVAMTRLVARGESSGRADDNEDTIRRRMQVGAGGGQVGAGSWSVGAGVWSVGADDNEETTRRRMQLGVGGV